jgi:hypothetical protein
MPLSILLAIRRALVSKALDLQLERTKCLPKHVNAVEKLILANDAALRWIEQQQPNDAQAPQLMLEAHLGVKHGS